MTPLDIDYNLKLQIIVQLFIQNNLNLVQRLGF